MKIRSKNKKPARTPEQQLEYSRLWRLAHPGYAARKAAEWKRSHPEKYRAGLNKQLDQRMAERRARGLQGTGGQRERGLGIGGANTPIAAAEEADVILALTQHLEKQLGLRFALRDLNKTWKLELARPLSSAATLEEVCGLLQVGNVLARPI